ncbi:amidase [Paenibacillus frigoriresistens]|uniref:amidase family protein n=1 Tax=Paenibacillus alginolyticus TaxID=59839 RepID=UPI0015641C3F|nr:amidase family protein [Paenibacillus frigoriresistens]NRF94135.1 amidase [Paenibacillus frigoriresistens]
METGLEKWIIEADIASMQQAMTTGKVTSEQLVLIYLTRIEKYDSVLNTILEINPDAIDIAKDLDEERKLKGSRGPLHGIPILLKDNIDTHDRMHTSAGSIALAESFAAADSFVAAQLRAAGAVLLGKTNMTEWAGYMSGDIWAGYSSRGGLTLNPYGPGELFVGGSSSGSAAATAANLAAAAIGTETSGSIISPSSQNSLVGIKPTIGLVSRTGIIPIAHSQDTAGPIARTVSDAAILLGVLTNVDERDIETLASKGRSFQDYTQFLDANYLQQARIGVPRFYYQQLDKARLEIVEAAIAVLKQKGATIVDPVELPCEQMHRDGNVMRYEFKKDLNDYLAQLPGTIPVHSLADVIAYNEAHADQALKYGQGTLIWSEETSGTLTEQAYLDSKKRDKEMSRELGIDHVLEKYHLDALLFLGFEGGADLAARAGYPSITVPGGYAATGIIAPGGYTTKGPQGITFVGTAFSEPALIKIAYGFEQATKHRIPPELATAAKIEVE